MVTPSALLNLGKGFLDALLEQETNPTVRAALATQLADHLDARAGLSRSPSGRVVIPPGRPPSGELPAVDLSRLPTRRVNVGDLLDQNRAEDLAARKTPVVDGPVTHEPVTRGDRDPR